MLLLCAGLEGCSEHCALLSAIGALQRHMPQLLCCCQTAAATAPLPPPGLLQPPTPPSKHSNPVPRSNGFERKVRKAKRAARSELSVSRGGWRQWRYATDTGLLQTAGLTDGLPRVDGTQLSWVQFVEQFERPRQPCIITGLCDSWRAAQEWTPERLAARLGDCKFKVGSWLPGASE